MQECPVERHRIQIETLRGQKIPQISSSRRSRPRRTWCSKKMRQSFLLLTLGPRQPLQLKPSRIIESESWLRPRLSPMQMHWGPSRMTCPSRVAPINRSISLLARKPRTRTTFTRPNSTCPASPKSNNREPCRSRMTSSGQDPPIATCRRSVIKFISRLKNSKTIKRMVMRKQNMELQIDGTKLKYLTKMEESLKRKREKREKIN